MGHNILSQLTGYVESLEFRDFILKLAKIETTISELLRRTATELKMPVDFTKHMKLLSTRVLLTAAKSLFPILHQ